MKKAGLRATTAMSLLAAYQSAGWKKGEDGALVLDDAGNPIYVDASGGELSVEHGTIGRLNGEAKQHRETARDLKEKLDRYSDIDPTKAREALDTVSKLSSKELIEAGKVDEVKAEITRSYETQLSERDTAINALTSKLNNKTLETAFKGSEFIQKNLSVPVDFVQAAFKDRFKVEDDRLVPIGSDGNPVYSKKRAGEVADFEEALQQMVEAHPHRDMILQAPNAQGTGNNGGGGNRGNGAFVKRADFDKMPPHQQAEVAGKAGTGEITIVD